MEVRIGLLMNEKEAIEKLHKSVEGLRLFIGQFCGEAICLDDYYTIDQLEAIIYLMKINSDRLKC